MNTIDVHNPANAGRASDWSGDGDPMNCVRGVTGAIAVLASRVTGVSESFRQT
jgi:hypothetical protein